MRLQEWTVERAGNMTIAGTASAHNADVRAANAELERLEKLQADTHESWCIAARANVRADEEKKETERERDEARAGLDRLKASYEQQAGTLRAANAQLTEARAEVERMKARVKELVASNDARMSDLVRRRDRIAELEAQLAEARSAPPLPESVEALKWYGYGENELFAQGIFFGGNGINRRHVETRELADDIAETHNASLEAAYALGLANGQAAEEKLAKVREVVEKVRRGSIWPITACDSIAAIVEPPHVHEVVRIDGIIGRCACGATAIMRAEWKDAPK